MSTDAPTADKRTAADGHDPDATERALAAFITITATGAAVSIAAPDAGTLLMGAAPVLALAFLGATYVRHAAEPEGARA